MTDTTDTNQETYSDRCARLEAGPHLAQDPSPFTTLVNEGHDKAGAIFAIADLLSDLCSANSPNQLNEQSIAKLMIDVLNSADRLDEIMDELHELYRQQGKSVQPDTPDTDTPDAVNDAAGPQQPPEQIPAPSGEWWEDMKTNACQCLGDAYSLGYDVGRAGLSNDAEAVEFTQHFQSLRSEEREILKKVLGSLLNKNKEAEQ